MKKIALLLADENNAYQQALARNAQQIAPRYGFELLPAQYAEGMPVKQVSHFFDCINSGTPPDGIVSMLVSAESMRSSIEKVAQAGISCVLVNRIPSFLPQVSSQFSEVLVASVVPDQVEIGRLQGRQCLKLLPDGGKVVLVLGASGAPTAEDRRKGFLEVVGNAVTVQELQGRWQTERAEAVANHLYSIGGAAKQVDLFVCQNDPMAAGVRKALDNQARLLRSPDIAKTQIIGCDGLSEEGQGMVRTKEIAATVVMPPTSPKALEMLHMYWTQGVRTDNEILPPESYPRIEELKPG